MHCWASDHLSSLCSQASLIFLALSPHDTFLRFHPCQDLIPTWPCLIRLSELKNVFDVICSPCSIFLFFSFFFFHHVSLMFYIRAVPLNTRNYKLPTKNGSNRHSNHPLWQCVCLIVCLIVWILLCFCVFSYIPLKCLKKKSGKAAQATEELYLKWTGTGLCHSSCFSLFTPPPPATTVIILPWLEPFVVCACCGWCAVTPNEDRQEKNKKKRIWTWTFSTGLKGASVKLLSYFL